MEAREIILMDCLATRFFPLQKSLLLSKYIFSLFFCLVNISFMFALSRLFLQFFKRLMPVGMETIFLIAEAEVNVTALHPDLKEPFSSGSLMSNLAFDVCYLPFSQDRACTKKHVKNHSFKNYSKRQKFCTL